MSHEPVEEECLRPRNRGRADLTDPWDRQAIDHAHCSDTLDIDPAAEMRRGFWNGRGVYATWRSAMERSSSDRMVYKIDFQPRGLGLVGPQPDGTGCGGPPPETTLYSLSEARNGVVAVPLAKPDRDVHDARGRFGRLALPRAGAGRFAAPEAGTGLESALP